MAKNPISSGPAGAPNKPKPDKLSKLNKPVTPLANLTSGRIKFRHLQ
ncbi:MAG: hypothetical protein QOD67_1069, partial [Caballeronia sp.]|nr:hypothetical protein [Caballeronia sp.]